MTLVQIGEKTLKNSMTFVQIGEKILLTDEVADLVKDLGPRAAIVTDNKVADLYGKKLELFLLSKGIETFLFTFPQGELHKTRETKAMVEDAMQGRGLGRDTCLIAIGGGVSLDLGGFVAATYCRGIPYISFPTTMLSMADGCIGGKTGVNTPFGKNLVGAFYDPQMVYLDISLLRSLPLREVRAGIVEMIKHGCIADESYFSFIEKKLEKIQALHSDVLFEALENSLRIKQKIVKADQRESAKRRLLNFGHTIGHAFEKTTHYALSHGEAIALGMLVEGYLSREAASFPDASFERLAALVKANYPELTLSPLVTKDRVMEALLHDKKSKLGLPRFVLLNEIGQPAPFDGEYCTSLKEKLILNAIDWMFNALHRSSFSFA